MVNYATIQSVPHTIHPYFSVSALKYQHFYFATVERESQGNRSVRGPQSNTFNGHTTCTATKKAF